MQVCSNEKRYVCIGDNLPERLPCLELSESAAGFAEAITSSPALPQTARTVQLPKLYCPHPKRSCSASHANEETIEFL